MVKEVKYLEKVKTVKDGEKITVFNNYEVLLRESVRGNGGKKMVRNGSKSINNVFVLRTKS